MSKTHEQIVEKSFRKIQLPFLSTSNLGERIDLAKEVICHELGLINQDEKNAIMNLYQSTFDNPVSDDSELVRFLLIGVLDMVIDEYYMTITNMPGLKEYLWEYLNKNEQINYEDYAKGSKVYRA